MFVFTYINTSEGISIIQGKTLDKVNKEIRKAVQNDEMYAENMDIADNWEIYELIDGKLVPHENYSFMACHQFL